MDIIGRRHMVITSGSQRFELQLTWDGHNCTWSFFLFFVIFCSDQVVISFLISLESADVSVTTFYLIAINVLSLISYDKHKLIKKKWVSLKMLGSLKCWFFADSILEPVPQILHLWQYGRLFNIFSGLP